MLAELWNNEKMLALSSCLSVEVPVALAWAALEHHTCLEELHLAWTAYGQGEESEPAEVAAAWACQAGPYLEHQIVT